MSDLSQGPGWWLASDGKWYPPKESEDPPGPGWWLASDGKWYPPESKSASTTKAPSQSSTTPREVAETEAPEKKVAVKKTPTQKPPAKKAASKSPPSRKASAKTGTSGTQKAGSKRPAPTTANRPGATAATPQKTASQNPPTPHTRATRMRGTDFAESTSTKTAVPSRTSTAGAGVPLTPEEQIARRDQASRADAAAVASKRFNAATRALASLSAQLDSERSRALAKDDPLGSLAMASPSPELDALTSKQAPPISSLETPTSTSTRDRKVEQPTGTRPDGSTKSPDVEKQADASPQAGEKGSTALAKPLGDAASGEAPLLELRPSAISGDLSRAGERLAIFNDRVEMRDRTDRVRESIMGVDITDVVVQKRFTGVILSIENMTGPVITLKGLTAQQAEQARTVIMRKTRLASTGSKNPERQSTHQRNRPQLQESRSAPDRDSREVISQPSHAVLIEIDEADLLRKLADLHRAGVINDEEFRDKVDVIHRLVHEEPLSRAKR